MYFRLVGCFLAPFTLLLWGPFMTLEAASVWGQVFVENPDYNKN